MKGGWDSLYHIQGATELDRRRKPPSMNGSRQALQTGWTQGPSKVLEFCIFQILLSSCLIEEITKLRESRVSIASTLVLTYFRKEKTASYVLSLRTIVDTDLHSGRVLQPLFSEKWDDALVKSDVRDPIWRTINNLGKTCGTLQGHSRTTVHHHC